MALKFPSLGFCHACFIPTPSSAFRKLHGSRSLLLSQPRNSGPFLLPFTRRRADPGDWKYSPEWWGTQGRGWGRNEGVTVFRELSNKSNGLVSVTSHPASTSGSEDWPEKEREFRARQTRYSTSGEGMDLKVVGCEWRVLRFNDETRQSVAKVLLVQEHDVEEVHTLQIPNCLAFEYLKSMVSVGLTSLSCAGLDLELVAKGKKQMRTLCIGLGGGSLPLFLVNKMQGCFVEVVEIDRTVISAATEFMGFPKCCFKTSMQPVSDSYAQDLLTSCDDLHHSEEGVDTPIGLQSRNIGRKSNRVSLWGGMQERISGFEADGGTYIHEHLLKMEQIGISRHCYDLVFVDAFDGNDNVPHHLWSRDGYFLAALRHLLHPIHGTVVVNLHTDMPPPSLMERITGDFGSGFDPLLRGGRQVQEISHTYRDVLLQHPIADNDAFFSKVSDSTRDMGAAGVAFTVAVPSQQNICVVVSQGIDGTKVSIMDNLKEKACFVEGILNIPFDVSKRVSRGFTIIE